MRSTSNCCEDVRNFGITVEQYLWRQPFSPSFSHGSSCAALCPFATNRTLANALHFYETCYKHCFGELLPQFTINHSMTLTSAKKTILLLTFWWLRFVAIKEDTTNSGFKQQLQVLKFNEAWEPLFGEGEGKAPNLFKLEIGMKAKAPNSLASSDACWKVMGVWFFGWELFVLQVVSTYCSTNFMLCVEIKTPVPIRQYEFGFSLKHSHPLSFWPQLRCAHLAVHNGHRYRIASSSSWVEGLVGSQRVRRDVTNLAGHTWIREERVSSEFLGKCCALFECDGFQILLPQPLKGLRIFDQIHLCPAQHPRSIGHEVRYLRIPLGRETKEWKKWGLSCVDNPLLPSPWHFQKKPD